MKVPPKKFGSDGRYCVIEDPAGAIAALFALEDRRGFGITMLYQATFRRPVAANAQRIVASVKPSSRRLYSQLLLFEVLGECKQYSRFLAAPSLPIGLDLTTALNRYNKE